MNDGATLGCSDGTFVGLDVDGTVEGAMVGFFVGLSVGPLDVGACVVGECDGC